MTMTARDTIAELLGWKREYQWWRHPTIDCVVNAHPIPNTIDFIAAVWPEGVRWFKAGHTGHGTVYFARIGKNLSVVIRIADTGNELANRMSLYAQVLEWLRDNDRPAFDAAVEKARRAIEEAR